MSSVVYIPFVHARRHGDLVAEQLRVTDLRIAEAAEAAAAGAERERHWLGMCKHREVLASCLDDLAEMPAAWPQLRLGLTPTESRVLWVLVAHELSPRSRARLRELNTEPVLDVTLDTVRRVVYGSRPDPRAPHELAPHGTLRHSLLIEPVDASAGTPEHRQTFRVSRRVLALVHGTIALDDELFGLSGPASATAAEADLVIGEDVREAVRASLAGPLGVPRLVVLHGRAGSGRRSLLLAAAAAAGRERLTIDARELATDRAAVERQLRLIARECQLLRRIPVFLHLDALGASAAIPDRLDLFEAELRRLTFATTTEAIARRWRVPWTVVSVPALTAEQRRRAWMQALPMASDGDAERLATTYPLAPAWIRTVGRVAIERAGGGELKPSHIEAAIRTVLDDRLAGLAQRIEVTQTWDDLVLPEGPASAIVELLARIRKRDRVYEDWGFAREIGRGLGITALFSGPPGTGKTTCAGLIAADLGRELYQVDPSKLASEWAGEAERNLAALFDAAEAGHAILLFDAADALFGKRTSVPSGSYLLRRLERFSGICLLTTNHEAALDDAFRRRLSVHVRFPVPVEEDRAKLWRASIPAQAPVEPGLPFEELAGKYVMGPGSIRNAVLRAAFLAAEQDARIGAAHLIRAAQLEYEAMGKLATG